MQDPLYTAMSARMASNSQAGDLRKIIVLRLMQAKGGSFGLGADRELYKFKLGAHTAIPAIEEAVASMKPGGIRRLIVPVELGYPDNNFNKKGPKPSTFSVPLTPFPAW